MNLRVFSWNCKCIIQNRFFKRRNLLKCPEGVWRTDLFLEVRMSWSVWVCHLCEKRWRGYHQPPHTQGHSVCVGLGDRVQCCPGRWTLWPRRVFSASSFAVSWQKGVALSTLCFLYSAAAKPRETWILFLLLWWVSTLLLLAGCRRPGRWALGVHVERGVGA